MAYNKIITSEGNVQFQTADGSIINVHPFHIYTTFNEDTVSFILIAMPKYSGLAIFTSKASDLEVDGTVYTIEQLPNALSEAFAKAGAVARYEIVDELPTSGQSNTIYLVPKEEGVGYDEYIYVNGEWELIGDTDIEFDKYLTKEAFSAYSAATELKIDGKVVELTQAEYDSLVSGGTIDPLVLYVITDAVEVNMADYYKKVETSGATELSTAFANEASARTDADTALQGLIDVVSGNVEGVQDEVDIISASLEDEVSARTDADNAISAATNGKLDTSIFETYSGNVETALDAKVNTSDFNTYSANTQTAINAKQDTLVAGSGITISGNVISAEAQPITVDPTLDSGSTNAVANSAITNAINAKADKSTAGGGLVIETTNNHEILNLSNQYGASISGFYNEIGFGRINNRQIANQGTSSYENFSLVETSAITTSVTSSSTDAQVPSAKAVYDALASGGTVSSAITSGDTNAVQGGAVYDKFDEVEQVTAAGLNALNDNVNIVNDKFDGLQLKKLTQQEYDALVTKDSMTLYIITD